MTTHQPSERSTQWLRAISASGPLLPSLISFFFPPITLSLFTPRQVINDNNLWSFLFGIWASPTSFSGHISRAIQTTFVFFLPASTFQHYWLWLFVATLRTCVGQLLTRVVGWAAPQFFSHWALYEAFGGYGPSITVYIFLNGGPSVVKPLFRRLHKASDLILLVCLSALFCWLDDSPWTYGVAILGAGAIALALWVIRLTSDRTLHPMLPDIQKQASPPKLKMIIESAVLALFVISLPYAIHDRLADSTITDMPPAHSATSPLLDIIVLSFPRPDIEASMKIMATTINSYLPHVNSNVTLSVFTHSTSHTAFIDIRKLFASANITFYTDADEHPDYWSGQYLHIAEAFRWAVERPTHAEWVMLVEDDFPLCGGDRGWDALKRVMQILEARSSSQGNTNRQGGFIGTGGSGLIIHRSMLPILIFLMRTHAEIASKLPPTSVRRPADLVMQDCLLGTDPLCTQDGGKLVITSRLIMDHIGGMVTTNRNKALNSDKWRCGWRHPFHGSPRVEVVVV